MIGPDTQVPPQPASATQLLKATAAALVVAIVILGTVVLPVEYGLDPLGTGAALGLLRAGETDVAEPPPQTEAAMTPVIKGPLAQYGAPYKVDSARFELGPYEYLEYKYALTEGASMLFAWEATAPVIYDMHGAPDGQGSAAEVSVDKRTGLGASGSLTAAFAGMHGWFWENPAASPVTISLTSAGFYSAALETRTNRRKTTHTLATPQPVPAPPER
jgi:hypothetical protein